MAVRPWRALTILLLLAAAFPPPRVVNLWIADAPGHDSHEAKKTVQARGRNRVGSPIQLDSCRALAPLAGGKRRPPRPAGPVARRHEPTSRPFRHASPPPALSFPANLRLRC